MKATNALSLAIAAGCIASPAMANNTPIEKTGTMPANLFGHIYYNVATGEKIATSFADGVRPVDAVAGQESWIADDGIPCADYGQTVGTAVIQDDPLGNYGSPITGDVFLDWGDIEADTVIDALQLDYFNLIPDVDTDLDGIGDGVEGYAGQWVFYDADNGFDTCLTRTGLVGFTILNLAGTIDGSFGGYLFTLDLATDFGSPFLFEIGDTDSDLQGANVHNAMINFDADSSGFGDADLDSDGLADFAYSFVTIQPGTVDFDNADGDSDTTTGVDGDPANQELTAIGLSAPFGTMNGVDNGDGTWSWSLTPDAGVVNAFGAEDAFDIFNAGAYIGTYWMGGVDCGVAGNGPYTAYSQVDLIMYSPPTGSAGCNAADMAEPYGTLDIADVFAFLGAYNAMDAAADLNNDGLFDIADVFAFLGAYNAGCP